MKKKYTKKQITEAIAFWEKQLKMMNESNQEAQLNTVTSNVKKQLKEFNYLFNIEKIVFVVKALNEIESQYREFAIADPECGDFADAVQAAALSISDAAYKAAKGHKL